MRNDFESSETPYQIPQYWFKSMVAKNTVLNNGEIKLDFNPQMTTIIGGRGSGKSSILRFIRGVFQRIEDLIFADSIGDSALKKEQEHFFKLNREDSGVILNKTIIEIVVNKYGQDYKIVASNFKNKEPGKTEVFKIDSNGQVSDYEVDDLNDFFKFDVYSQKQIYEIAKYPNALRDRIDDSIKEMEELKNKLNKKKNDYNEQSAKIRSLKFRISKKQKLQTDIRDKKEQISSFKESGFEDLIIKFKTFNSEYTYLIELYEEIKERKKEISSLREEFTLEKVNENVFQDLYQKEMRTLVDSVFQEFEIVQSILQDAESKLEKMNLEYTNEIKKTAWYSDRQENDENFNKAKEELEKKGINDLKEFENVTAELTKLEKVLKDIKTDEKNLENEYKIKDSIYQDYINIRDNITETRRKFLNQVSDDGNVKIELEPFRDRIQYLKRFREIIQKERGFPDDIKLIGNKCFHGKSVKENQRELIKNIEDIRVEGVSDEFHGRFVNVLRDLNEEQLDELSLHLPEDKINVKYRSNNSGNFQALSNASAGQKTSAILTFLLSYGDVPLLLDQPEDDLDNNLIYELIVDRLKVVKKNRQIIIVTHNANIPVNGDTEWLISMNSKSKNIETLYCGTIEENKVKAEICNVMEGGEDAFKLRAKRYNL